MKERLEAEKEIVERELAQHGTRNPETGDWQGSVSGDAAEGADVNTTADTMEALGEQIAVVEELEQHHKDIVAALQKIELGTYGTCEVSGEMIPEDRLEANPAARTCIEHAQQ